MGGESKVREHIKRGALAAWQGSLRVAPRGLLATLAATVVAATALTAAPTGDAQAQRLVDDVVQFGHLVPRFRSS